MSYQSEAELEKQLINKLSSQGYSYIKLEDYKALENNFRVQLNYINKSILEGVDLSDKEFERILIYLNGKTVYQSAKQLRDQFILDRDNGKQVYINFLNENPENNVYQVTNQVTVQGKYVNRYDVTILINGLPLVQIELKRRGVDINQAINQIDRYRQHSFKELFKYIQIFVVSNGVETRYFANTNEPRIMKSLTFYWTREDNERINILENFSSEFLEKNRLLKMITKYMVINDTDKCLIVMRPYQVYATEALIRQALNTNSNGYIWHTTGSGKTLTSWKCANLLKNEPSIAKVFFLIDRKDLDTQTIEEFNKFEKDCVDNTDDTKVLVKQVKDPNKKLIVTTIQKMAKALNTPKYLEVMNKYKNDKVIFIIDECHRSQFGEMHNQIKRHFVNAQYFGFTGTPRFVENKSQDGRTTADMFQKLLHAYLIKNAIHDHNVLGFSIEYIQTYEGEYDENDETRIGDIGTPALVNTNEQYAYYVSLALIKCSRELFPNWLVQAILSNGFQKQLYKRTLHVAFPKKINKGEIGECIVNYPCIEEQEKIAGFLSKVDELINECEGEVKDLEEQKKGLMQKIFSQQIRFKDSNNNPYPDWEEKYVNEVCDISTGKYYPKWMSLLKRKKHYLLTCNNSKKAYSNKCLYNIKIKKCLIYGQKVINYK